MDDNTNLQNDWLTPAELESEFGFKQSTQAKLRMNKKIPYSKIGTKLIRYNRSEINQWLSDAKVV